MLIRNIVASRIKFIGTEIYAEFRDDLSKAGVSHGSFASRLDNALKTAESKLREVESEKIAKILNLPV